MYANALSSQYKLIPCYSCPTSSSCTEASAYVGAAIQTCQGFRLPTEAEWEYAYRAGSSSAFYNGPSSASSCGFGPLDPIPDKIAWYWANTGATKPVKGKLANPWGLYDMSGNVWEWTNDYYGGDLGAAAAVDPGGVPASQAQKNSYGLMRVGRGGAYFCSVEDLRGASRLGFGTGNSQYIEVGFRLARTR
jgi:sulfatase modifying factor 1